MASPPPIRRTAAAASALLLVGLLGACTSSDSDAEDSEPPPDASAEGLERFYAQELAFEPCEPYATTELDAQIFAGEASEALECARLEVPLDYTNPDGETASIALSRLPATGDEPIGSLLTNPGGPGFSGLNLAPMLAATAPDSPVLERFDLIGIDPRGVGASEPAVDCYTDEERENNAPLTSLAAVGPDDSWTEEDTRRLMERCAEGSGGEEVLKHLGTRDAARDLDVLRAVLGDDQLSFFGLSYGTRLGAVYAETFPENVRALLLDGPMDPYMGSVERRESQYAGLQRSFELMAASCAELPDCPLGSDPDAATERFQEIVRPLIDEPVPAGDGRVLAFQDALDGVTAGLYGENSWPQIIEGIREIEEGRGDTLLALHDSYYQRDADGGYSNALEATMAINCLDEDRQTPEERQALTQSLQEIAAFADPGLPLGEVRDECESWPVEPTLGYPYATEIDGLPETLTVAVTGDGLTPYEGGERLAEALGGSLLTVEGEQHGAALIAGNACVDDIVADYLIDLETPEPDARCVLE